MNAGGVPQVRGLEHFVPFLLSRRMQLQASELFVGDMLLGATGEIPERKTPEMKGGCQHIPCAAVERVIGSGLSAIKPRFNPNRTRSALHLILNASITWCLWNSTVFSLKLRIAAISFIGRPSANNCTTSRCRLVRSFESCRALAFATTQSSGFNLGVT